jgi:hypothetical protein
MQPIEEFDRLLSAPEEHQAFLAAKGSQPDEGALR